MSLTLTNTTVYAVPWRQLMNLIQVSSQHKGSAWKLINAFQKQCLWAHFPYSSITFSVFSVFSPFTFCNFSLPPLLITMTIIYSFCVTMMDLSFGRCHTKGKNIHISVSISKSSVLVSCKSSVVWIHLWSCHSKYRSAGLSHMLHTEVST